MSDVPEILFVCVHNAGRSQMAAALLDWRAEGRVHVRSAGSANGATPPGIRLQDERTEVFSCPLHHNWTPSQYENLEICAMG